jgi:hypothetical protein
VRLREHDLAGLPLREHFRATSVTVYPVTGALYAVDTGALA